MRERRISSSCPLSRAGFGAGAVLYQLQSPLPLSLSPSWAQQLLEAATRGSCCSPVLCRSCAFSPKSCWFPNASSKVSNYQAGGTENLTLQLMRSDVQAATHTKRCPQRQPVIFLMNHWAEDLPHHRSGMPPRGCVAAVAPHVHQQQVSTQTAAGSSCFCPRAQCPETHSSHVICLRNRVPITSPSLRLPEWLLARTAFRPT